MFTFAVALLLALAGCGNEEQARENPSSANDEAFCHYLREVLSMMISLSSQPYAIESGLLFFYERGFSMLL